jgi:ribosomal protein S18 acetylase RimI-like enzyme
MDRAAIALRPCSRRDDSLAAMTRLACSWPGTELEQLRVARCRGSSMSSPELTEPTVEEVVSVTPDVARAIARLVPQLSSSAPPPTEEDIADISRSPATVLLVARDSGGEIVGSLTLVLFRAPTGPRSWIEDVVVDEAQRGGGIGSALVNEALARARAAGARTVDLTSRPSREMANRLYVRLGFTRRETNVYRYQL